jgi:hypothetical protein
VALESRRVGGVALVIVERLEFGRWDVADGPVQTPVVPPVDPPRGCQFHLLESKKIAGATGRYQTEQVLAASLDGDDRLGTGVIS